MNARLVGRVFRFFFIFVFLMGTPGHSAIAQTDTGAIAGTVNDQQGHPIADSMVCAYDRRGNPFCAIANADGYYIIQNLAGGEYRLSAGADGWGRMVYTDSYVWDEFAPVQVAAGQTTAGIDFNLVPGGRISGTVYDLEGNPVPYRSVNLVSSGHFHGTCTDQYGHYSFDRVAYGVAWHIREYGNPDSCWGAASTYISEYWPEVYDLSDAAALVLDEAHPYYGGIDFYIEPGLDPYMNVRANSDQVDAHQWLMGHLLTLTIDDPHTLDSPDYTISGTVTNTASWDPNLTSLTFDLSGKYDIQVGDVVRISDEEISKARVVSSLAILDTDFAGDTLSGTAEPKQIVHAWTCWHGNPCVNRQTKADASGNWSVTFATPGPNDDEQQLADLRPGSWVDSSINDPDGDSTMYGWSIPNPTFSARASEDRLEGWGWSLGSTVQITVNGSEYQTSALVGSNDWDPTQSWFQLELQGYDLKPGDIVQVTDGTTVKEHTVQDFEITDVDLEEELVRGHAAPNQSVDAWTCGQNGTCVHRWVTAGEDGAWTADFSVPQADQQTADLQPGSWVDSSVSDEDGDSTMFSSGVPNPTLGARLAEDEVHGYGWTLGSSVTLTIDDPNTPQPTDYSSTQTVGVADWDPNSTWVVFRPGQEGLHLQARQEITMTDGKITKQHIVTSLSVLGANPTLDTIAGTATTDSWVDVQHCDENGCVKRHVIAQATAQSGVVNGAIVADEFLPPSMMGYNGTIQDYTYDPALSKSLLSEAGYPNGFTTNLWLRDVPRIYLPHAIETAQAVRDYLSEVGITANIQVLDSSDMITRTLNGEADLYLLGWGADYEHADNFFYFHFCTEPDALGLPQENAICSRVLAARAESDPATQIAMYKDISQAVHDDIPLVPLAHGNLYSLFRQSVHGFTPGWSWLGTGSFQNVTSENNTLTYAVESELSGLDPAAIVDGNAYKVTSQVLETLVTKEPGAGLLSPALAESWSVSPDGLTWIFNIRSGVTFHDGTPLNAEAVIYNLERWWNPSHPQHDADFQYFQTIFNGFKGDPDCLITNIELIEGNRVQITLRSPFSPLLNALTMPPFAIASPASIQAGTLNEHPVGTGPFMFQDQNADTVQLTANPDYWRGTPMLTSLRFKSILDHAARYAALEANTIQGMQVDDWGDVLAAQGNPDLQTVWHMELNVGYLGINQAHGPLSNLLVREAIAHAIDKKTLLAQHYNAIYSEAGTWTANFAQPGEGTDEQATHDILSGDWGEAFQCDEDSDCTQHSWNASQSTLHAVPAHPEVHGHDWAPGSEVTLKIYDSTDLNNPLYSDTRGVDQDSWCGNPCFDLQGRFDLQVGHVVTLSDGSVTKTVHVSNLQITQVDADHELVRGIADPGSRVAVNIWSQGGKARYVTTDASGNWVADFSVAGDEDFEQFTTDIKYGDNGRAIQLNLDGSDDGTLEYWNVDWVAPPSIPVVYVIPQSIDLGLSDLVVETLDVVNTLQDSLFRLDNQGNLLPLAATDYSVSSDGLVYTVHLRPGAVWSDGQPVTAQNFVDGILRMLDRDVHTGYGLLYYPILNAEAFSNGTASRSDVGVRARDALTLEITLAQKTPHFAQILASPATIPVRQDLVNQFGDAWTSPAHYVSSGPYTLAEYDLGHIVVEKNPHYNGPMPGDFLQIGFDVIPDTDAQIAAYKNGDVDVLLSMPVMKTMSDPDLRRDLTVLSSPGVEYLGLSTQVYPTNNPLVRKALASAIDRQAILKDVLQTPWRVTATGVIPPELAGYQGSAVGYSFDPSQAKTYLAQAGYPNGQGFPVLHFTAAPNQAPIMQAIADQWHSVLGITVDINVISGQPRQEIMANCRLHPQNCTYNGYIIGWVVDYPDEYNILNDLFHPDSFANYLQWDNAAYRSLVQQASSELDPAQRTALWRQAEKILVEDDAAVAPLYFLDNTLVLRPGIYPYYAPTYFTNLAYWSSVDRSGDGLAVEVIGSSGGTVTTESNTLSVEVPPAALQSDVNLSVTDLGGNYQVTASQEELDVLESFSIQPHGLQFDKPVTLTFAWDDSNNDGIVDGTGKLESNIFLLKDGNQITLACAVNSNCDMSANLLTVEVSSLSHFELVAPVNEPPSNVLITAPMAPVIVNQALSIQVGFTDVDDSNTHTVTVDWGDGLISSASTSTLNAVTSHSYQSAGVYTIRATVTDSAGASAQAVYQYVVIYDPNGGFVTGSGWINSPSGAYVKDPTLSGKATFGFVSKYLKGANVPTGSTEFQFKVGNLNFKSTTYDWLVIAGTKAQYKGVGTINGTGNYGFMLTAIDGSPDRFRIKIWDRATGNVIYDNMPGVVEDANPTTALEGGSVVIHKDK